MKDIRGLVDKLKSAEVFVSNDEVAASAEVLANKIYESKYKRRDRTYEQVFKSCFIGRIAEVGLKKLLSADDRLDVFNDKWDIKDRSSYGSDLEVDGIKIEIKSQPGVWFELHKSALKTLRNNIQAQTLDLVITASYEPKDDGFVVRPVTVINPHKMLKYIKQSHFSEDRYFFDHRSAKRDGVCLLVR